MPRFIGLLINQLLAAFVFTFFLMVLILLLNPGTPVTLADRGILFLLLLVFYGPIWFGFLAAVFTVSQFFAEREYPIGFLDPPTPVFFLSFTVLAISAVTFANYEYYLDFFGAAVKWQFYRFFLVQSLILVAAAIFLSSRGVLKRWAHATFLLLLVVGMTVSFLWIPNREKPARPAHSLPEPLMAPLRKVRLVVMDGLSLNYLLSRPAESKLLNFEWLLDNGVRCRLSTYRPNSTLSLLGSALSGSRPTEFTRHSEAQFAFRGLGYVFDIAPRYLLFRSSARVGLTDFFSQTVTPPNRMGAAYAAAGGQTFQILGAQFPPPYIERDLKNNNGFVQFFAPTLERIDPKFRILKRAFFADDYIRHQIPELKNLPGGFCVAYLPGLDTVTTYFYHYSRPQLFGHIDEEEVERYGPWLDKYYEYYDSVLGNLISTTGDGEMLAILSLYEVEPLPVWRRMIVNLAGAEDVFVYRPTRSPALLLLYEKDAVRRGAILDASIGDIFPTLMYYGGFALPRDVRGEVLQDAFTDAFVTANPIQVQSN